MKATHYRRPIWLVMRFERDEDGRDDDCVQVGGFWDQPTAVAEQQRLAVLEKNPDVHYEIIATEAAGVYPNDEAPPGSPIQIGGRSEGTNRPRLRSESVRSGDSYKRWRSRD